MAKTTGYPIPAGKIKNGEARQLLISAVPPFLIRRSYPASSSGSVGAGLPAWPPAEADRRGRLGMFLSGMRDKKICQPRVGLHNKIDVAVCAPGIIVRINRYRVRPCLVMVTHKNGIKRIKFPQKGTDGSKKKNPGNR